MSPMPQLAMFLHTRCEERGWFRFGKLSETNVQLDRFSSPEERFDVSALFRKLDLNDRMRQHLRLALDPSRCITW